MPHAPRPCPLGAHGKATLRIFTGQLISLAIAGGGFFNNILGEKGMDIPIGQNLIFYAMLALFLIPYFIRNGKKGPKAALWKYLVLGVLDVQGNAMSAYSYQNASLTLISLLQLLSLPSAMLTSVILKMAKYRPRHYICMVMALLGMVGCIIYNTLVPPSSSSSSEEEEGQEQDGNFSPSNYVLKSFNSNAFGIVCGAMSPILFGILNALGEKFVTSGGVIEYIGFFGACATVVCGIESAVFEYSKWTIPAPGLWVLTETLVASGYIVIPLYLKHTPVTILNMSMLTIGAYGVILDCLALGADFSVPDLICEIWAIVFTAIFAWSPPTKREQNGEGTLEEDKSENIPLVDSYLTEASESSSETSHFDNNNEKTGENVTIS